MEEPNNCPKPDCGRPESTHRYSAGKKLSICGNGHSWDQQAISEQRAKAKKADNYEFTEIDPRGTERVKREMESFGDRLRDRYGIAAQFSTRSTKT